MTFSYPSISGVFQIGEESVCSIVIENQSLFCEVLQDISDQIEGLNGKAILSERNNLLDFSKYSDLLSVFIPFSINKKTLTNKILTVLEKRSLDPEYYEKTMRLSADVEKFVDELSSDFPCDLVYTKLGIPAILKAIGVEVADDSETLAEKIMNYMELVREFDRDRVFFTVNLRSFLDDKSTSAFLRAVLSHKYKLIMLESRSYSLLPQESRRTIDEDLCEF